MNTFGVQYEDVLENLPIDPNAITEDSGRINIHNLNTWINEADGILSSLLKMNGASVSGDPDSIVAGRAAVKAYAAAMALRKINNAVTADQFMKIWETERRVFAQKIREHAGAVPTETQVKSNIVEDPECLRKKFGRQDFEW